MLDWGTRQEPGNMVVSRSERAWTLERAGDAEKTVPSFVLTSCQSQQHTRHRH
jgi:hypothetical protein